ncbi:MAG TPA: acyl-CoA dehydrogenase family protein [Nevskiaceae bacterium]|nr:acyl-CoA dehydrogenase family protein [Nevskiaceae bacterium]
MDFESPEERRMLADTLERYLADHYAFAARQKIAGSPAGHSTEAWRQLAELGAVGVLFPEAAGGLGGDAFDVSVVFEVLGHWLVLEPFLDTLMVGRALLAVKQASRLAPLIDGSTIAALAHDEPANHYEATRVATTAVQSKGQWVLNGAKSVVHNAETANWLLVSARTAGTVEADEGITLFAVPRVAAGVTVRGYPRIDGGRAGDVTLKDVSVASDDVIGEVGKGAKLLETATHWGLLALCAESVGVMDVARRQTVEYLHTRKQFGVIIGSFQALQHRMANLLVEIESARSSVINAAAALNSREISAQRLATSAAKYTVGHVGIHVAEECIQMHGGIGMTWELPLPHYAKRLVMIDHELGDEDHHLGQYMQLSQKAA